ncbi:HlyD family type I secretion periplasmic adaptor subunit [Rhizobium sullae]|uniref:Membrane fusion protein (MFP) family protein n=1 Tax=Rhizobium sullae TaxID=50338 RepID=A0A4R3PRX1_RHISU|nr:HlyD family type I secretion periplasmic adaptor subunit [Rhizobium sullae]TCU06815.1 HlyD family secretion protein [Rhizobium sullae]
MQKTVAADNAVDLGSATNASELPMVAFSSLIKPMEPLAGGTILAGCIAALLFLVGMWLAFELLRRPKMGSDIPLDQYVRGTRRLGWVTIAMFFGAGGALAVMVPMSGAAMAPGVISPDGSRKSVQHFEGGIIQRIHVREGQSVKRGEKLVTLDDIQARAALEELEERLSYLLAAQARLVAERSDDAPVEVVETGNLPERLLAMSIAAQEKLLQSRRETRRSRQRLADRRVQELREKIFGFQELAVAQEAQHVLLEQEIASSQSLVKKGLERLPRLLELQRMQADLGGEQASARGEIASHEQTIQTVIMELQATLQQERQKGEEELASVQAELAVLRRKMPAHLDVVDRTTIIAPIDGTVMNVQVTTETGVVKPGEQIMEIVPTNGRLVLDARLSPMDIDVVNLGMSAKVILAAYAQRNLPQIHGVLRSVSADSLTDERTGQQYFLAKIDVDAFALSQLDPELQLQPGMPAEVFILTGERTAMDYLVRPIVNSITRSFRES